MQSMQPYEIRERIVALLKQIHPQADVAFREVMLIHQERYVGHRYILGEFHADWTVADQAVKVYNATGRLIRNLQQSQLIEVSQQKAA